MRTVFNKVYRSIGIIRRVAKYYVNMCLLHCSLLLCTSTLNTAMLYGNISCLVRLCKRSMSAKSIACRIKAKMKCPYALNYGRQGQEDQTKYCHCSSTISKYFSRSFTTSIRNRYRVRGSATHFFDAKHAVRV